MKQLNKLSIIFLIVCSFAFYGCANWLDVHPRDQVLEERQFSTELGINSALNGIYRSMAQRDLYGELLTQTFIEYMARYYNFTNQIGNFLQGMEEWSIVAQWQYQDRGVRRRIQDVWNSAYRAILETNIFIQHVSETDVLSESRRDVLLGEAYALRAFLHFDMFRLFGPIMRLDPNVPSIPFSDSPMVISRDPLPATTLLNLVLRDLETAERLLENDPVRTRGVNDNFHQISTNIALSAETIFAEYFRNRRMNYYAVRALRARVLLHAGRFDEARQLAKAVIDEATANREGGGRPFRWETNWGHIITGNNFMFYNEVLFGITNPNLHSNWRRFFDGSRPGSTHVVVDDNLFGNLFGDVSQRDLNTLSLVDIRAAQWRESNIPAGTSTGTGTGMTFISTKFRGIDVVDWRVEWARYSVDFQPLIRLSEMPLIIAEAYVEDGDMATAAYWINFLRERRRATADQTVNTINDVEGYLMRQIYLEFVGEGQAFFFLKRNAKTRIFSGFNSMMIDLDGATIRDVYVLPLPDSETIVG